MSAFRPIPLGQPIPDSPHAVLCSLPRLADVIGYEERRPEVVAAMQAGYPRFFAKPLVVRAQQLAAAELGLSGREVRLVSCELLAVQLARFIGEAASAPVVWRGTSAVHFPAEDAPLARAKAFLQHTGAQITSRQAEDILLATRTIPSAHQEVNFPGDALAKVRANLAEVFSLRDPASILLTGSGMGAFFATFNAIRAAQAPRGRHLWLQLGWQYVDTTEVLKKFLNPPERFHFWPDVFDTAGLAAFFQKHGHELAGVVSEFPTNPLFHSPDLPALHALCQRHGVVLVVDPTAASPRVVNVLPHCDVVCNSLTKFAANEGDVMAGGVVFNPASPWAGTLREPVAAQLLPLYPRDLSRLAAQIDGYAPLIEKASATTVQLVEFLAHHPGIREVYWTGAPRTRDNFARLACRPGLAGSIFSISLRGDLARFYDRIRLVKGPSFGTNFSLLCPFMYLAHYDLVTTPSGRAELAALGLDPALIRISIGTEPLADLTAAFSEALA